MSRRLQLHVPEALDRRIRKAAARNGVSAGAWMRQAIEGALEDDNRNDALHQLTKLGGPTGDIERVLAEIGAGRG
jgi:hypothetical protein